ncbi:DUF6314 family protein [Ascidiaceihabitans sp.]|nr:DUF6314 family protein [Ascidiaceihabitans sp.]
MSRILSDFAGRWKIERDITPASGPVARFLGFAEWRAEDGLMHYIEKGNLEIAGQTPMMAERRYRWDADLNIYFDDGQFFHQLPALGGDATHWCDPDQYDATYDFTHWPQWSCTWRVKGPRKDYTLHSQYSKT